VTGNVRYFSTGTGEAPWKAPPHPSGLSSIDGNRSKKARWALLLALQPFKHSAKHTQESEKSNPS
jgi:hypothetical protein